MRRSIASLALAAIALLLLTASVAAADPFGWGHRSAAPHGPTMQYQGPCCSGGWSSTNVEGASTTPTSPTSADRPVANPQSQTRRTQIATPSSAATTGHHSTAPRHTRTRSTQYGSDWREAYGHHDMHDMHDSDWH